MESESDRDPEARLQDFQEEDERCVYRSGSEETVDTVVAVSSAKKQQHTEAENSFMYKKRLSLEVITGK